MAEAEIDPDDKCFICHDVVGMGAYLIKNCRCNVVGCIPCIRRYYKLNSDYIDKDNLKCPLCPMKLGLNGKCCYLKMQIREFEKLDKQYGKFTCPLCNIWQGFRTAYDRDHLDKCPEVYMNCKQCGYKGLRKNHATAVNCEYCHKSFCGNHECPNAPKCEICRLDVRKHKTYPCYGCQKEICFENSNTKNYLLHLLSCDKVIIDRGFIRKLIDNSINNVYIGFKNLKIEYKYKNNCEKCGYVFTNIVYIDHGEVLHGRPFQSYDNGDDVFHEPQCVVVQKMQAQISDLTERLKKLEKN